MFRKVALFAILAAVVVGCSAGDEGTSASSAQSAPSAGGAVASNSKVGARRDATGFASASDSFGGGSPSMGSAQPPTVSISRTQEEQRRAQVRGASLQVRVEKLEDAEKKVQAAIKKSGGYEETLNSSDLAGPDAAITITAKVPVEKLDEVLSQVEGLGTRTAKTVSMLDVTENLQNWDTRLKALKDQQSDLRRQGANNVGFDQYQNQAQNLQTQIDYVQKQRADQAKTAAFSTIELSLKQGAVPGQHDPNWLAQSYGQASSSASEALRITATGLLWLVFMSPFYMPFVAGGWFLYRFNKRRRTSIPGVRPNVATPHPTMNQI